MRTKIGGNLDRLSVRNREFANHVGHGIAADFDSVVELVAVNDFTPTGDLPSEHLGFTETIRLSIEQELARAVLDKTTATNYRFHFAA